jgi:hypothetical protein
MQTVKSFLLLHKREVFTLLTIRLVYERAGGKRIKNGMPLHRVITFQVAEGPITVSVSQKLRVYYLEFDLHCCSCQFQAVLQRVVVEESSRLAAEEEQN